MKTRSLLGIASAIGLSFSFPDLSDMKESAAIPHGNKKCGARAAARRKKKQRNRAKGKKNAK